jgi:hypothetical protein
MYLAGYTFKKQLIDAHVLPAVPFEFAHAVAGEFDL